MQTTVQVICISWVDNTLQAEVLYASSSTRCKQSHRGRTTINKPFMAGDITHENTPGLQEQSYSSGYIHTIRGWRNLRWRMELWKGDVRTAGGRRYCASCWGGHLESSYGGSCERRSRARRQWRARFSSIKS